MEGEEEDVREGVEEDVTEGEGEGMVGVDVATWADCGGRGVRLLTVSLGLCDLLSVARKDARASSTVRPAILPPGETQYSKE